MAAFAFDNPVPVENEEDWMSFFDEAKPQRLQVRSGAVPHVDKLRGEPAIDSWRSKRYAMRGCASFGGSIPLVVINHLIAFCAEMPLFVFRPKQRI
eukprot:3386451-Pyramimonas_sp.AAC.1